MVKYMYKFQSGTSLVKGGKFTKLKGDNPLKKAHRKDEKYEQIVYVGNRCVSGRFYWHKLCFDWCKCCNNKKQN